MKVSHKKAIVHHFPSWELQKQWWIHWPSLHNMMGGKHWRGRPFWIFLVREKKIASASRSAGCSAALLEAGIWGIVDPLTLVQLQNPSGVIDDDNEPLLENIPMSNVCAVIFNLMCGDILELATGIQLGAHKFVQVWHSQMDLPHLFSSCLSISSLQSLYKTSCFLKSMPRLLRACLLMENFSGRLDCGLSWPQLTWIGNKIFDHHRHLIFLLGSLKAYWSYEQEIQVQSSVESSYKKLN